MKLLMIRHALKSTMISSQIPIKQWFDVIGDPTVADAIMDRLYNGAYRIEMEGESMRKLIAKRKKLIPIFEKIADLKSVRINPEWVSE
jgi:DNA replication protein DnaC